MALTSGERKTASRTGAGIVTRIRWLRSVVVGLVCVAGFSGVVLLWPSGQPPEATTLETSGAIPGAIPAVVKEGRDEEGTSAHRDLTVAELDHVCGDPWIEPSTECSMALDHRFGNERMSPRWLITTPYEWYPGITDAREEWAMPGLGGILWHRAFEDPLETRQVAGEALSRTECVVASGRLRPRLRERCAADEMAKLGVLHVACVGLMVRDDAWQELGVTGKYEEDWRSKEELVAETAVDQDAYWRGKRELMEERLRFAWRLQRCREVPRDALAWVDVLPVPEHDSGAHQGVDLLQAAARLGHRGAALWSINQPADLAVVARWDRALASLVRSETEEEYRLEHLIAAVELSYLDKKPWHEELVERVRKRYTREELLTGVVSMSAIYPQLDLTVMQGI